MLAADERRKCLPEVPGDAEQREVAIGNLAGPSEKLAAFFA